MNFEEADAALAAIKKAYDVVINLLTMQPRQEARNQLAVIQDNLLGAQKEMLALNQTLAALLDENADLKKRLAQAQDVAAEREDYRLVALGPNAWAYVQKAAGDDTANSLKFCVHCLDRRQKSLLQRAAPDSRLAGADKLHCQACGGDVVAERAGYSPLRRL